MKKSVPFELIKEVNGIKYGKQYPESFLQSLLYMVADPEDNNVYDYPGLLSWFESWRKDDELYHDSSLYEYITDNIDRTVYAVSVPNYYNI